MEFEAYSVGIVSASVCTSLTVKEATELLNDEHPTGISSKWSLSKDKTFRTGQTNGCNCPDYAGNKHYLFNC